MRAPPAWSLARAMGISRFRSIIADQRDETCVLHFAYGSNMCVPMMRHRCPTARLGGCAVLPGYRFIITQDGFASIISAPGGCVHGLLWRLTPRDLAALNAYEQIDSGLYRAATMAVVANRRSLAALVFIGRSRVRGEPRPGYMDLIAAAARDAGFPPHYVRTLARLRQPTGSAGVPAHSSVVSIQRRRGGLDARAPSKDRRTGVARDQSGSGDQAADDSRHRSGNRISNVGGAGSPVA